MATKGNGLEAESDRLLRRYFGKRQGIYPERTMDLASIRDSHIGQLRVEPYPTNEPLRRLVNCLHQVSLTDTEERVLQALIALYAGTGPRPVFRAVAKRAQCAPSTACVAFHSAAAKLLAWAEAHPPTPDPRQEMIDLLVEVFGWYAVRLAGII